MEELILATNLADDLEWKGVNGSHEDVIELSKFLRESNIHPGAASDPKFRSPNSVGMKINNLRAAHPEHRGTGLRVSKSELNVVSDFLKSRNNMKLAAREIRLFREPHPRDNSAAPDLEIVESAVEGGASYVLTLKRERNPGLRRSKIKSHLQTGGLIRCEICEFDFAKSYGERGEGYIEVHHRTPLHASGSTRTELSDLILVCSNCHRMLHRGKWVSPQQLMDLLNAPMRN